MSDLKKATHELIVNRNGTTSLRELSSGEVMHSSVGPREEATLLYIEQSRLAERLSSGSDPLVLFDVGLGAGTNALAALTCARDSKARRPLRVVSFETDPSGFQLAYENKSRFPFFDGFDEAAQSLIQSRQWSSADQMLHWELHAGDFLGHLPNQPAAEIVFFDFYSPNVVPNLWTVEMFKRVLDHCSPSSEGVTLYTYSASTRVRSALLLAGFYVGYGRNTGAKLETTVASTLLAELERPLDERWLQRFDRSHAAVPHGTAEDQEQSVRARIHAHIQFRRLKGPLKSPA